MSKEKPGRMCVKSEVILIFLVPYTIMLFVVGIPIMIFESVLGQFYNVGAHKVTNNFLSLFFDSYKCHFDNFSEFSKIAKMVLFYPCINIKFFKRDELAIAHLEI